MNHLSTFQTFLKYVSLNILGQLAYSCYTLADTFFVSSNLGTDGLTALNLAFPVFCFINGAGLMLGMGIFGAILATGMAPVISMIILSPYFIRKKIISILQNAL